VSVSSDRFLWHPRTKRVPLPEIIISEHSREWDEQLSSFLDASVYQTWGYGEGRGSETQAVRLRIEDGGQCLGLVQLRQKTLPGLKAGLAHSYFGPVVRNSSEDSPEETLLRYQAALRGLIEGWIRPQGLLLRLVSHLPEDLYPGVGKILKDLGFRPLETRPYRTILVDLRPDLDVIKGGFRSRSRTMINKALKQGIQVEVGEDSSYFERFEALYDEMVARKAFHSNLRVSTFARAQEFLRGKDRMRVFLATFEGTDIGGLVLSAMGDMGIYLLGATRILKEFPNHNGSRLLHWKAIEECKVRGLRYYDLCGIDPEKDPGGYRFKKGFRGQEIVYPGTFEWGGSLLSKAAVRAGELVKKLRGG